MVLAVRKVYTNLQDAFERKYAHYGITSNQENEGMTD